MDAMGAMHTVNFDRGIGCVGRLIARQPALSARYLTRAYNLSVLPVVGGLNLNNITLLLSSTLWSAQKGG